MQYWGLTDPGCVRTQNQDTFQVEQLDRNSLLCVVCDGMGGAKSGNVASSLAADVFVQEVKRSWTGNPDEDKAEAMLRGAVKLANFTVYDQSMQFEEFSGMGTTLVAATVEGDTLYAANIGDSRLYLIEKGGIRQVTKDHSFVEEMVSIGQMERESKEYKQQKNIITRAVGIEKKVEADFFEVGLKQGDYLLLCSDGLSNMVDNSSLFRLVLFPGTLHMKAKSLVALANQNGGKDNIAVVLVEPEVSEVRRA